MKIIRNKSELLGSPLNLEVLHLQEDSVKRAKKIYKTKTNVQQMFD